VGNQYDLANREFLILNGVTHVLNMFEKKAKAGRVPIPGVEELFLNMPDGEENVNRIVASAARACQFIDNALAGGGGGERPVVVLVPCKRGKSRSAFVVAVYLMLVLNCTFADAADIVMKSHSATLLNWRFSQKAGPELDRIMGRLVAGKKRKKVPINRYAPPSGSNRSQSKRARSSAVQTAATPDALRLQKLREGALFCSDAGLEVCTLQARRTYGSLRVAWLIGEFERNNVRRGSIYSQALRNWGHSAMELTTLEIMLGWTVRFFSSSPPEMDPAGRDGCLMSYFHTTPEEHADEHDGSRL
jgi:hypothetical protein